MSDFADEAAALRRWLFDSALPLWWEVGADRSGGFHEAIDLDGTPVRRPQRARSIARMAFCYCEAGRLGWSGPWREAASHALEHLRRRFVSAEGTIVSAVALDGRVADATFDLYNQAFALLAFAHAHCSFGAEAGWRGDAVNLREKLEHSYAHPKGGFRDDPDGRSPQRSNPHMHLLEAALAWMAIDKDARWRAMADGIATLCLEHLIEPASGGLRENFDRDWLPAPGIEGRITEPGHLYEWAFLLDRWARLTGRPSAPAAMRLIGFADAHGVDARRGVAVGAVLTDGSTHDPVARLWAQAECLRAYSTQRRTGDDARLAAALKGLRRFLATPVAGLWFDRLTADDQFINEPARATSLYHIVGAVAAIAEVSCGRPTLT